MPSRPPLSSALGHKEMKVGLLSAKCGNCNQVFSCPQLGDQSYGQAIFRGERGTVYAYFNAIDSTVFEYLRSVLPAQRKGDRLFATCAHLADAIEGQRLSTTIVCPHCSSTNIAWWGGKITGSCELPAASFSAFMSLSEPERRKHASETFEAQLGASADGSGADSQRPANG